MRKIAILAGVLFASGFASAGSTQAEAVLGCQCVRFNATPVCTGTIADCTFKMGGACLAPCAYEPPKKMARSHKKKM
jgi:hypothetical protein